MLYLTRWAVSGWTYRLLYVNTNVVINVSLIVPNIFEIAVDQPIHFSWLQPGAEDDKVSLPRSPPCAVLFASLKFGAGPFPATATASSDPDLSIYLLGHVLRRLLGHLLLML